MKMEKRKFRIGQLAKQLSVEQFVIRFWEKEFNIKPSRSQGKQRFYDEKDLLTFSKIKQLLYEQGFTISGAKKQLINPRTTKILASQKTTMDHIDESTLKNLSNEKEKLTEQILHLQKKLLKLRELL